MSCALRVTVGIAGALHALALLVPVPRVAPAPAAAPPENVVTVDLADLVAPAPVPALSEGTGEKASALPQRPGMLAVISKPLGPRPTVGSPVSADPGEPAASVTISAEPKKPFPSLIDLSSPGKHTILLPSAKPSSAPSDVAAKKLDAMLAGPVDTAGPVVSAAHDAASGVEAPEVGWVTFDVDTDATGAVTEVRLVEANDHLAWSKVGPKLKKRLAATPLKVPTGAAGVTVRVKVSAAMKLPSGAAPGAPVSVAPKGLGVGGTFDLADIGQKPRRLVQVSVVTETRK